MKRFAISLFISVSILSISCASTNKNFESSDNISTDQTYGYTEKNPIKVGGGENGPVNERKYLSSLTGPNGEKVTYLRNGSCCAFLTRNSPFGGGLLDIYSVTYEGKKDSVTIYVNMYDKATLKAPVGFKMK